MLCHSLSTTLPSLCLSFPILHNSFLLASIPVSFPSSLKPDTKDSKLCCCSPHSTGHSRRSLTCTLQTITGDFECHYHWVIHPDLLLIFIYSPYHITDIWPRQCKYIFTVERSCTDSPCLICLLDVYELPGYLQHLLCFCSELPCTHSISMILYLCCTLLCQILVLNSNMSIRLKKYANLFSSPELHSAGHSHSYLGAIYKVL